MMINWTDTLTAKDYLALRSAAGWTALCEEQAQAGLDNTDHILAGYDGEKIAAAARVLWDKGHVAYLCDVIVMPEYRPTERFGAGMDRWVTADEAET